jgi:hypothetical protein
MPDVEHRVTVDASYRVTLRGELEDAADATRLEAAVRAVPGVDDVVNLIHRPGEAAPNKADAIKASH